MLGRSPCSVLKNRLWSSVVHSTLKHRLGMHLRGPARVRVTPRPAPNERHMGCNHSSRCELRAMRWCITSRTTFEGHSCQRRSDLVRERSAPASPLCLRHTRLSALLPPLQDPRIPLHVGGIRGGLRVGCNTRLREPARFVAHSTVRRITQTWAGTCRWRPQARMLRKIAAEMRSDTGSRRNSTGYFATTTRSVARGTTA